MDIFKKTPSVNFMKYRYIALAVTAGIVLAGVLNIFVFKGLKLGVDFGEGTMIRVAFRTPVKIGDIRNDLAAIGLGGSSIQQTGEKTADSGREFQIRSVEVRNTKDGVSDLESHEALSNRIIAALRGNDGQAEKAQGLRDLNGLDAKTLAALLEPVFLERAPGLTEQILDLRKRSHGIFADYAELEKGGVPAEVVTFLKGKTYLGKMNVVSRESVGPQAGADLRKKAVQATIWSLLGMLVYIALRFKLANGVSAILTLTQDVLITMSLYSFSSREINLPIIAGILTIVGFSINDTIVIFDRIRENQKLNRRLPLIDIMNLSLNQMLGRTIITSGTVFLTVIALFLFGGKVINDFAYLMLIGTIEGVYSTIYLSCPIVLWWTKWFPAKSSGRK
ncbi:MAG: protein translocase subunit SecF [Acidobacteriota bacterium]|nr:protein translocase subunit SecF [Acidobacteriota bacterium]